MAAITKIEFWSDVGFIDGAVEIPRLDAAEPINPDMVIEPDDPIMPSKDRFFTELKLKEYYTGLLTMSYMRVTYDLKNSLGIDTPNVFYGWVDSVKLSSDGELPMTVINWHIDEWRTWKSAVTFGSGHVKRRPFRDLATTPIQNYPVRYVQVTNDEIDLTPRYISHMVNHDYEVWWALFSANKTDNGYTSIISGAIPLLFEPGAITGTRRRWFTGALFGKSGTTKAALTYQNIMSGLFDEHLGFPASSVNGIWLTPYVFDIDQFTGTGNVGDPILTSESIMLVGGTGTYGYYTENGAQRYSTITFQDPIVSSEEEQWVLVDLDGSKILELPYGIEITGVDIFFDFEPDQVIINFAFKNGLDGRLEGCVGSAPLPSLPANENALSDYIYSGQREYDREARTIQSNSSAWKSSATGAGSGAMMGAFGAAGLAAGAIGGVSGGLIGYGVEMLYQNDEEQRILDRLKANQPSSLLFSGNSDAIVTNLKPFRLVKITPDSYSAAQITNTRAQFGVSVDELMNSCDLLIRSTSPTGYYNIQNMIVNGNVPVSAKKWIREKFRSGVRLI